MPETIRNASTLPLAPIKSTARLDPDAWWYECPVCGEPLDYKQRLCGCCSQRIDWACAINSSDENPNDTAKPNWIVT